MLSKHFKDYAPGSVLENASFMERLILIASFTERSSKYYWGDQQDFLYFKQAWIVFLIKIHSKQKHMIAIYI